VISGRDFTLYDDFIGGVLHGGWTGTGAGNVRFVGPGTANADTDGTSLNLFTGGVGAFAINTFGFPIKTDDFRMVMRWRATGYTSLANGCQIDIGIFQSVGARAQLRVVKANGGPVQNLKLNYNGTITDLGVVVPNAHIESEIRRVAGTTYISVAGQWLTSFADTNNYNAGGWYVTSSDDHQPVWFDRLTLQLRRGSDFSL
jgi:hypothetical protein